MMAAFIRAETWATERLAILRGETRNPALETDIEQSDRTEAVRDE